jgi:tRNA pseudouridine38-40 synthase
MQRFFMQLSYDGTNYHGWQIQPNGISVQEVLEKVLSAVSREKIVVTGAGRTDTGVHASFYVAHFDSNHKEIDSSRILYNLNCMLPQDIAIQNIYKVRPDAHARFDAIIRSYEYYISRIKNPFCRFFSEKESRVLDLNKMNEAAALLMNYRDFTSFSKLGTDVKTNICRIFEARWEHADQELIFRIKADRFLRNMVRAIVGTLLEVGLGRISVADFSKIIEVKNRNAAGPSVAAKGLFLTDIVYPEDLSFGLIRQLRTE